MAPLTPAARLISAFQRARRVFYCYNGIFTSSSAPLSAVTMTALIAFAGDYTVPPPDKSKENQIAFE